MEQSAILNRFISLVDFDQHIRQSEKKIVDLKTQILAMQDHIRRFQQDLEAKKTELNQAKKQLADAELELKSIDTLLTQKKSSMEGADYKSLQSQKQEIDRLSKLQSEQERIVIQLVNRIDNLVTGFEKHSVDVKEKIGELEQKMHDATDEQRVLESELELKKIQRPEFEKNVPKEWLDSYHEMRNKVPDPVVPLSHESCSGCFSILTAADLQLLRKNNLVRCKICFRLIYPEIQRP